VYVEPLYIAAEKGQLPELKRVMVGFGDRIAMDETLDGAIARVFGRLVPQAGTAAAPRPSAKRRSSWPAGARTEAASSSSAFTEPDASAAARRPRR
jgi:uncharacterized protein